MDKNQNSERRGNAVESILNNTPKWTLKVGLIIVGLILFSLYFISNFLKYSDTISGTVHFTDPKSSAIIDSPSNAKILSIYVEDGEVVFPGQELFHLEIQNEDTRKAQITITASIYGTVQINRSNLDLEKVKKDEFLCSIVPLRKETLVGRMKIDPEYLDYVIESSIVNLTISEQESDLRNIKARALSVDRQNDYLYLTIDEHNVNEESIEYIPYLSANATINLPKKSIYIRILDYIQSKL